MQDVDDLVLARDLARAVGIDLHRYPALVRAIEDGSVDAGGVQRMVLRDIYERPDTPLFPSIQAFVRSHANPPEGMGDIWDTVTDLVKVAVTAGTSIMAAKEVAKAQEKAAEAKAAAEAAARQQAASTTPPTTNTPYFPVPASPTGGGGVPGWVLPVAAAAGMGAIALAILSAKRKPANRRR